MQRIARTVLIASLAFPVIAGLTGCATTSSQSDSRFVTLEPYAETEPEPDAIVGMWQHTGSPDPEGATTYLLFRKNGTGTHKASIRLPDGTLEEREPVRFTYEYTGGGVWSNSIGFAYRIANAHLLETTNAQPGRKTLKFTYDRVE